VFWKKKSLADKKGPTSIPGYVGKKVVDILQKRQDMSDHWVKYKGLYRPHAGTNGGYDIRIFDEWDTDQKGIKVGDYAFLDAHPDLVQFEGWCDEKTRKVEIRDVRKLDNTLGKA
jgi:hypothetical protein